MVHPRWLQVVALGIIACLPPVTPKTKNRPNIALVIVDDLAMDALGAYRAVDGPVQVPSTLGLHKLFKHIPTPEIDRMAREGALFTRAYTATPICSPSRYSLLVGKYPSRSRSAIEQSLKHPNAWQVADGMGVSAEQKIPGRVGDGSRVFVYNHFNVWVGAPPKNNELTMAHALREAGYRTGLVGKWHLSWRQQDPHACSLSAAEYDEERELVRATAGFDFVDALHTCNIQSSTKKGMRFSHNPEFTLHHAQRFVNESMTASGSTDAASAPWFLYMGLTLPHPPNARLALTKYSVSDTPAGPGKFAQQEQALARRVKWRTSVAKVADDAVTAAVASGYKGSWEKNSHNSASVAWLDAVVGEWLGWLRARGVLDDTLVVFTADHGLMGKRTCNEHGIRVSRCGGALLSSRAPFVPCTRCSLLTRPFQCVTGAPHLSRAALAGAAGRPRAAAGGAARPRRDLPSPRASQAVPWWGRAAGHRGHPRG